MPGRTSRTVVHIIRAATYDGQGVETDLWESDLAPPRKQGGREIHTVPLRAPRHLLTLPGITPPVLCREGFMHRARLLAPVLLFVAGCGDGGSQTPTSPPAPPTNRAPTASTTIAGQSVEEGAQVTVDISGAFSDPDGDALRYGATSDASSVATASVSGSDLKVIGKAPGSATITVTATDPGGLSANQTFEVTVAAGSGGADLDALFSRPRRLRSHR